MLCVIILACSGGSGGSDGPTPSFEKLPTKQDLHGKLLDYVYTENNKNAVVIMPPEYSRDELSSANGIVYAFDQMDYKATHVGLRWPTRGVNPFAYKYVNLYECPKNMHYTYHLPDEYTAIRPELDQDGILTIYTVLAGFRVWVVDIYIYNSLGEVVSLFDQVLVHADEYYDCVSHTFDIKEYIEERGTDWKVSIKVVHSGIKYYNTFFGPNNERVSQFLAINPEIEGVADSVAKFYY